MNQEHSQQAAAVPGDGRIDFAERPPSQAWERLASPDGRTVVWTWFKPAHAPYGLILRVPDETYQGGPKVDAQPTMRKLLDAAGIDPASVSVWYLYGAAYDGMSGTTPLLDAPIPPPVAGVDPNILVYLNVAAPSVPQPGFMGAGMPGGGYFDPTMFAASAPGVAQFTTAPAAEDLSVTELFERIDADWHSSIEIERELSRLRKMLLDLFNKLKNLNRDLTPTERVHANNQDKQDWIDARRWLRDGSTRLWRCIKEHDIGDTSTAGQRGWFEQTHRQFVVPRIPFDGLLQAQRDFEAYRKMLQTLHNNMSSAHAMASADGERRAEKILSRIAAKIRDAQTKRNFLGTMID